MRCRSRLACARDVRYGLADVLAGKCDADDAIVQGPAGVQMLLARGRVSPRLSSASRRDATTSADFSRHAQDRMLTELESLSERFDLILVDAGRGLTPWSRRFWSRAKLNLLVTTPEDGAVLDAYAVLKLAMAEGAERLPIRLLVNQADNRVAADTERRMENACQKFLSRSMPALPSLPRSFDCGFAGVSGRRACGSCPTRRSGTPRCGWGAR